MSTFTTAFKWTLALLLSALGTLIVMATLGLSTQVMGWSLLAAAHGDDVMLKYQILLAWTLVATSLAFLVKIGVLTKHRNEHSLRWTEYLEHGLTSGVLAGGLAYGAVAVVIAAIKGLGTDMDTLGETDQETLANLTLIAIFPILIVMMAAVLTAYKSIVEIPKSSPPDPTIARRLPLLRFVVIRATPIAKAIRERCRSLRGKDIAEGSSRGTSD